MSDIRQPAEEDREQVNELVRISFNPPGAIFRQIAPELRLERILCAYEGSRVTGVAIAYDLGQWFGGRAVKTAGVATVASLPERRGAGLGPELVRAVITRARERGAVLSTLYPSRVTVYRRLGYEYAGLLTQFRLAIEHLPSVPASGIEELADADMEGVRACYRKFVSRNNGPVESAEEDWWRLRIVRRWNTEVTSRAVVARTAGGEIAGYATFQLEAIPDTWHFRIACTHLVACTHEALSGLLGYFRSYRGLGQTLQWWGAPNDPISLFAGGDAQAISVSRAVRNMSRVLDVKGALEGRGYAPIDGEATIEVEDEIFADNAKRFRIRASDGRVEVDEARAGGAVKLPIGSLSTLYTGYASAWDLARAGKIEGDERSLQFLTRLFSGPTPWCTDFF